jgi:L-alanine-DL-glutamate epimerase-like enolase superfamily enzyme
MSANFAGLGRNVKINKVEVFLVGAQWRQFVMVKLTTDSGLAGWGEGSLGWKESAVREMISDFGRRYVRPTGL